LVVFTAIVFSELELALERHADHAILTPIHNAPLLARAPRLSADIAFFLQVPESCWQGHPTHVALVTCHAQPLEQYVHRLRELADAPDPSPLLAHAYVRYFGDLSGGQILRRTLAKAYDLEVETEDGACAGLSFYEFTVLGGDRRTIANPAQVSHIKEWLRTGMDRGTMDDPELKSVHVRVRLLLRILTSLIHSRYLA
jgi:heme oxygenase